MKTKKAFWSYYTLKGIWVPNTWLGRGVGPRNCTKSPRSSGFLTAENLFFTLRSSLAGRMWPAVDTELSEKIEDYDTIGKGAKVSNSNQPAGSPNSVRGQIPGIGTCESVQRSQVLDTPSSRVVCPSAASWTPMDSGSSHCSCALALVTERHPPPLLLLLLRKGPDGKWERTLDESI